MDPDNALLSAQTHTEISGGNEAAMAHVSQGALQTAGEEPAVVQSLKSPKQKVASAFSTSGLTDSSQSLGNLATYNEVLNKLNNLFEEQQREIQTLPDSHWKSQEFPLARIKKIMRMDEEVKMISAEVPIMFSKAVELFITELSLRAWLHTDEAKKRTLQRGDIAMAITKHDMFDFLIDIVPREEVQLKARSKPEGDQVQVVSPELLQLLIQQLAQQQASVAHTAGGEQDVGAPPPVDPTSNALLQQQIQLIQHLVQQQMLQQDQQQQIDQESILDLQQHAESHAGGGGGELDPTYGVLPTMATAEHLSQPVSVAHQNIVRQPMAHSQSLSGGHQMLHHVNDSSAIDIQDVVMNARPQPISVVVQSPPPLLDQGPRPSYQGLQHLHEHHHHHQSPVVVQVIEGNGSEGIEFQHIPESESISRSISPITRGLHSDQDITYSSQSLLSCGTSSSLQNAPRTS